MRGALFSHREKVPLVGSAMGPRDRRSRPADASQREEKESLLRRDRREARALVALAGGDRLGGAHGAQDVLARQLADVGLAPAATHQLGQQGGIGLDPAQAVGQVADAVEVAAEADVVDFEPDWTLGPAFTRAAPRLPRSCSPS